MTPEEAKELLLLGATSTESQFINIERVTLLIALGQNIEGAKDGEGL